MKSNYFVFRYNVKKFVFKAISSAHKIQSKASDLKLLILKNKQLKGNH
jgi:hypothetical protein